MIENWIWLPDYKYKNNQSTYYNSMGENKPEGNYTVCKISRFYQFDSVPSALELTFSADTAFLLMCNGESLARGPAYSGGDFLGNSKARGDYYSYKMVIHPSTNYLDFCALVRMMPYHICEYSKGQGGFFLYGKATFENGKEIELFSDDSWQITHLNSYTSPRFFDGSIKNDAPLLAEIKEDVWHAEVAPVPPCVLENLRTHSFLVGAHKSHSQKVEYDKVYAGYIKIKARASGKVQLKLTSFELERKSILCECVFLGDDTYYSLELSSVGGFDIEILNESDFDSELEIIFEGSHYPIYELAKTKTSDSELNDLMEICAHTLKYCRQAHHLDSPLHCEPLACVGDYYIEMLMTQFSFGDLDLCEFDLRRIARTMEANNGRLFHTSYSLIWVKMIYEYYLITGKIELLRDTLLALDLLFARFDTYIGENGLIETPPDYMFVDWLMPDGISMHHPPKALGQSCLNMFYYGALVGGEKIYSLLGKDKQAKECKNKASALKASIFEHLYDKEKCLFFEGLNTKTPEHLIYQYMPQNVEKRYYRRHANILACYFSIVEGKDAQDLLDKIFEKDELGEVQPYFMHYWLDAVYIHGLREKYTLKLLEHWKNALRITKKGLPEGFYPPEPTYKFDYSHAWGGTPLFALPQALCGLEIKEAGYKKIKLSPCNLGLDSYFLEIPTPYGKISIDCQGDKDPKITVPCEIELI